ncbi:GMC oxidoreductase [Cylindrobasidium torrendii FP15055 ss-10]|uniref:GMC oxidoreductase n=1 Tax=Cylindrobasidium torrendii FP15055 ss-10 TaxID=1314674 RepID=A0A0D7BSN9_9AGAR|nr:GMC oxidoreductase [Cylindrobasidium torrendii FP15055 ss-10]
MTSEETSFDIILVGGGTTSCVIAGRLHDADPDLRILVLERGPHTRGLDTHTQPSRFFSNLIDPSAKTLSRFTSIPNPELGGRQIVVPAGHCIGGGSAVNFMMYTRASASDYDDWEKLGNPGWGSSDLIPLACKAETYTPFLKESKNHGTSGPILVSPGGHPFNVADEFLSVAAQYDKTRPVVDDISNFENGNAYGRWAKYIDPKTGMRSDAAVAHIYNKPESPNLVILTGKCVSRVVFEDGIAKGVECIDEDAVMSASATTALFTASRMVVLAAGAFGSPLILERSGIGAQEALRSHGIATIVDLPGVGENYNDHNLYIPVYYVDESADCMVDLYRNVEVEKLAASYAMWKATGQGLVASNGIDAGSKVRPSDEEIQHLGPHFREIWSRKYAPAPDKPLMWIGTLASYLGPSPLDRKVLSVAYYNEYLESIGSVHIASNDPLEPPVFDCGYLKDSFDLIAARWAYKMARELARRMKYYRGEFKADHPAFKSTSQAACHENALPVLMDAPNIVYTEDDDRVIDEYHRAVVATAWHALGTCAMKPREDNGVVDPQLNVYGVQKLKVADMSIAPLNVSANTYNTALIIGEKAAVIIGKELGLSIATK